MEERFWNKVDIRGPDDCWEWTGGRSQTRRKETYGLFRIYKDKGMRSTHRVAWELVYGPIPKGLCVLHSCDNPLCCNSEHLFLGTQQDNVDDMFRKGRDYHRGVPGEQHPRAKLTNEKVLKIRELYQIGFGSQRQLGRLFGVSQATIMNILTRKSWKHI